MDLNLNKNCNKCKKYLPLNDFKKDSRSKDGRFFSCRKCCHEYYLKNRKRIIGESMKWTKNNPDKVKKIVKKYNSKPERKAHQREVQRKWREKNIEAVRLRQRRYYWKNRNKRISK